MAAPQRVELTGGKADRRHILTLDGGGVRGLSSLIILKALLNRVEKHVQLHYGAENPTPLPPHKIFDLAVGTSTGGLIALMIGKLGMSVDECIEAYNDLSETIFSQGRHLRGTVSLGLYIPRYSEEVLSSKIAEVFRSKGRNVNERMTISRLLQRNHPTDETLRDFAHSHPCDSVRCTIGEAARATSAAPSYFRKLRINRNVLESTDGQEARGGTGTEDGEENENGEGIRDRREMRGRRRKAISRKKYRLEEIVLFDGGLRYNNPSTSAWYHYRRKGHSELVWTGSRLISLGTGLYDKRVGYHPPKLTTWQKWIHIPSALQLMKDAATDPQQAAEEMARLADVENIQYYRFSATTGVCWIKLDDCDSLRKIRTRTERYLEFENVRNDIDECAKNIARDYVMRPNPPNGNVPVHE